MQINLKYPAKVVLVAPAGAVKSEIIDQSLRLFEEKGWEVLVGAHARGKYFVFSGTEQERIKDFQEALDNPTIGAIFCARGGYGTVQIIDQLDFTEFKKYPKWIVGFSDITVIHLHLAKLGIPSLHADMPINYPQSPEALNEIVAIFAGKQPCYEIASHPLNKIGVAEGILTGGNLSIINGLRATPYDLIAEGRILFLEDLCEDLYHIERLLQNLRLSGVLEKISGLVVGQFTDLRNEPPLGVSLEEMIIKLTAPYNYPIVFNFPSGHIPNNQALIMGRKTQLKVNNKQSTVY